MFRLRNLQVIPEPCLAMICIAWTTYRSCFFSNIAYANTVKQMVNTIACTIECYGCMREVAKHKRSVKSHTRR